ncbi:hypothetical protein, partial [Anaerococcus sp.]|uniref:hypothetical protein n=1 Tax=Anaerococcus sp. TaxID=1872515 RepID=UPI0029045205
SGASIPKHRSFPESKNKNQIRVLIFELRYKKTIYKQICTPIVISSLAERSILNSDIPKRSN